MGALKAHGATEWHAAGERQKYNGRHHYLGSLVTFSTASWPEYGGAGAYPEMKIVFSGKFLASMHACTWPFAYLIYTCVASGLIEANPLCFATGVLVLVISVRKHTILSRLMIVYINISVTVHQ